MAELEPTPKRSQMLVQLERVCRLQHAFSKSLLHHPNAVHHITYKDTASRSQSIAVDAQFNRGLSKIRRALIAECHDQGFVEEIAQIFKRVDAS
jgi:hypothetical protein